MSAKTILYVEDNDLNRKIVRDLLRRTSYRLLEAPDARALATADALFRTAYAPLCTDGF